MIDGPFGAGGVALRGEQVHRRVLVAVAAAAALVLGPAAAAGAAACAASDVGCRLGVAVTDLGESLQPAKTAAPTTTTTTTVSAAPSVGAVSSSAAAPAAPAAVTPTTTAALAGAVPPVPHGATLDLPPLELPDFGVPAAPTVAAIVPVPQIRAVPASIRPLPPTAARSTAGPSAGLVSLAVALAVASAALVVRRVRVPSVSRLALLRRLPRPRLRSRIRVVSG